MSKKNNDFLFIPTKSEDTRKQKEFYNEQCQYLKTHSIKDTLSTPLEQIKYENQKTINERDF